MYTRLEIYRKLSTLPYVSVFYKYVRACVVQSSVALNTDKLLNFYSQFIGEDDLCFDVGANIGNRSSIFLKLGARVIAIEPQNDCIRCLKQKFKNNTKIIIVEKGLNDKDGELPIYICEAANTISTFSKKWKTGRFSKYNWSKCEMVKVTTIDNLIMEFGKPIYCKIDVEGFELQVIKGMTFPIPFISFEFSREFFSDAKCCIDYLLSLGYNGFNCSLGEEMEMISNNWIPPEELYKKLSLIEDDMLWGDIYARWCQTAAWASKQSLAISETGSRKIGP